MLPQKVVEIGDKDFTITALSVADARQAYARAHRVLVLAAESVVASTGTGAVLFATFSGGLSEEDIDVLTKLFAPRTMVDFRDGSALPLTSKEAMDRAFSGALEHLFEWLDACLDVNFAGLMAKMSAAALKLEEAAAAKKTKG